MSTIGNRALEQYKLSNNPIIIKLADNCLKLRKRLGDQEQRIEQLEHDVQNGERERVKLKRQLAEALSRGNK